ncbi:MAG: thiolase family protein [Bacillota bacterium]
MGKTKDVFMIGVGMTRFGWQKEVLLSDLGSAVCRQALNDAGITIKEVEALFCAHSFGGRVAGQRVLRYLGTTGIPVVNVENACAGGSTALHLARAAVAAGQYRTVLVLGMEQMSRGLIPPNPDNYEAAQGLTLPAKYALRARRHMALYGLTEKQLALVAVKNLSNGSLNPYAKNQTPMSLEQVLQSRMIAEPLTLYQCTGNADGAAAMVISDRPRGRSIRIRASVLGSGRYTSVKDQGMTADDELARRISKLAYEEAGLGPEDVDLAEVHDAFTIGEILAYENLGFCKVGEGGKFVEDGLSSLNGKLPVNPSGGLIARGHPLGATGVAQACEMYWQLTGQAGNRQVSGAKVGLTHTAGGATPNIGSGACVVSIFSV